MKNKVIDMAQKSYNLGYQKGIEASVEPMITWMVMSLTSTKGIGNKRIKEAMDRFIHFMNLNQRDAESIITMQNLIRKTTGINLSFVNGNEKSYTIDEEYQGYYFGEEE